MEKPPAFPPIDYAAELNEDQLAAVTSRSRNALVLAGAGSGKTRTLTYRVAWLLEQGIPPWRILLLTFTNKAADEMLERIEDLTGVPRSQFWGGTFHSVGQRILRSNAAAAGIRPDFTILDADDADSLFGNVCKQIAPAFIKSKNAPTPRVIFDAVSFARNTRLPLVDIVRERFAWAPGAEENIPKIVEEYTAAKREQNACDYDDLLELFLRLLRDDAPARERYRSRFRHILIDEFQDTNTLQSEIIRLLAGDSTHVMAVGDDAQCIYTWRGANYKNIVDFPETFPETQVHKIEINYRSTPEILDFSNSILNARTEEAGFSKHLRATRESGPKPLLLPQIDAFAQARAVVAKIRTLVEDDGYALSDIIVLYRAHFQAKELQLELTNLSVPFVITSGVQFFQQAHVRDFVAQLRFVQNNSDVVAFTRILSLIDKIGPRTAERTLIEARKTAAAENMPLLSALLAAPVLKKIPQPARDDYQDLILTLQNMAEALGGTEISAGEDIRKKNLDEKPAPENPHGELFEFFAGAPAGTQKGAPEE
ncbi:MAG TPA: ATP-dependent helicase, partial [Candidatus Spyradosoma merdigallinarum]|nr:ATP-dependent helicase [Candidatus Spyradosoma merdigallinarum]